MGGTQRLLVEDPDIYRRLDKLNPFNLAAGVSEVTVVVDNVISGGQLATALKYYVGPERSKNAMYFSPLLGQLDHLRETLLGARRINICTVLYTKRGIDVVASELRPFFANGLEVEVVSGRDMGEDAWFSSTSRIGEGDKSSIREFLGNAKNMELLSRYFEGTGTSKKGRMRSNDIESTNLVARFKSLPKKSFWFLSAGLRADKGCHLMVRVPEESERSK